MSRFLSSPHISTISSFVIVLLPCLQCLSMHCESFTASIWITSPKSFYLFCVKFNYFFCFFVFLFYSVFLRIELHRIAAAGGPFDNRFEFPIPDVKTGRSSFPGGRTYRLLSGCSSSGRVEGAYQPGSRRSGGGHPSWIATG